MMLYRRAQVFRVVASGLAYGAIMLLGVSCGRSVVRPQPGDADLDGHDEHDTDTGAEVDARGDADTERDAETDSEFACESSERSESDTWVMVRRTVEPGRSIASSVMTIGEDVIVIGLMAGKLWAARLDAYGASVWQRWLEAEDGAADFGTPRASRTADGDVVVAAAIQRQGEELGRPWFGLLDSYDGSIEWQQVVESTAQTESLRVLGASNGTVLLAWADGDDSGSCSWVSAWFPAGDASWATTLTSDPTPDLLELGPDRYLAMIDGNWHWGEVIGPYVVENWLPSFYSYATPRTGIYETGGDLFAAGEYWYDAQKDFWLVRLDEDVNIVWSTRLTARPYASSADCFPECDDDWAESMVMTGGDELVVAGTMAGAFESGSRAYLIWLNDQGTVLRQRWLGTDDTMARAHSVTIRGDRIVVAGEWEGNVLVASLDLHGATDGPCSWMGDGNVPSDDPGFPRDGSRRESGRSDTSVTAEAGSLVTTCVGYEAEFVCPQ